MDPVKEAFQKVKSDIDVIKVELEILKTQIEELTRTFQQMQTNQQTNQHLLPTGPTHDFPFKALKTPISSISTGNEGVPTNQPTNQQTNQRTGNEGVPSQIDHLERVSDILNSLDALKKEVRIKFKRLTSQEMVLFSKIYDLEEAGYDVTYELLASQLNLTEISIRDYAHKIMKKGIPLDKIKLNNKKILLKIPEDLKRIASLQTIQTLREL